jgi:hypothetical protein
MQQIHGSTQLSLNWIKQLSTKKLYLEVAEHKLQNIQKLKCYITLMNNWDICMGLNVHVKNSIVMQLTRMMVNFWLLISISHILTVLSI